MGSINSKQKGNRFEQYCARVMRALFPDAKTSRATDLSRDAEKVDLTGTKPFNVQCKHVERSLDAHNLLAEMPSDANYNVLMHKRNQKGTVVCLTLEDFMEIAQMLKKK